MLPASCAVHVQGVVYTHRSNWLHALMVVAPDALSIGSASSIMVGSLLFDLPLTAEVLAATPCFDHQQLRPMECTCRADVAG